jgi:hypothetical protein
MLGLCVYGTRKTAIESIGVVQLLSEYLELDSDHIVLERNNAGTPIRIMANKPNFMHDIQLPAANYSIHASENENEDAVIENAGVYVSYFTNDVFSSLIAYSDRMDLVQFLSHDFCAALMRNVPAKYGFAVDWREKSSFWAYAAGFQDMASLNGNLLGETPAGRWGVALRRNQNALLDGNFRDIYPVNFLTNMHLSRPIPNGEARDLICSGKSDWGQISEVSSDWHMWIVPKERIEAARREFLAASLLDAKFI